MSARVTLCAARDTFPTRATPHHGAVQRAGGVGQHRGTIQENCREPSHAMQDETPTTETPAPSGRSFLPELPAALREALDRAVADGATVDEIAARIRADGERCARPAGGGHAKDMRDLMRRQQEADRMSETWMQAFGERPEGRSGLILIETLRTMALATMAHLSKDGAPLSTQELARLSLAIRRIEGTDTLRLQRERAKAKAAAEAQATPGAGPAPVKRKGLSPETVAWIQEQVEGRPRKPRRPVTSAPVDPWSPVESPSAHAIPAGPAGSRRKNRRASHPDPARASRTSSRPAHVPARSPA